MATTADTRERDLVKCDGCGMLSRRWHRLVLSADGTVLFNVQLCRACETDTTSAMRLTWRALVAKP